ncbi:hypothetical protein NKDENANG_00526 [Candidatus Entotheonellaceae bacterium PAL068K]
MGIILQQSGSEVETYFPYTVGHGALQHKEKGVVPRVIQSSLIYPLTLHSDIRMPPFSALPSPSPPKGGEGKARYARAE